MSEFIYFVHVNIAHQLMLTNAIVGILFQED